MKTSTELKFHILDEARFPRTVQTLKSGIIDGVSPGFVAGFWSAREPDFVAAAAFGNRRLIPSIQAMTLDTVFDIASLSKVMATAALAGVLVDRGWLRWDLPVQAVLPEYSYPDIRVSHLLSHTAGLVWWHPFWESLKESFHPEPLYRVSVEERQKRMQDLVFKVPPECAPGEKAVYSDLSFLVLGFLLERIVGMPLNEAVAKWVWEPLGMSGAFYRKVVESPEKAVMENCAATEQCPWRGGVLQGQVHDDNCWAMGGYGGHAGAFATLRDVLCFAKGTLSGFFSPTTLRALWTRVPNPPGCERTLGWDTPSGERPAVGSLFSSKTVGHLGFTGTSLWIDPEAELAVCLLSNRVHPSRENIKIRTFRPDFHEALRLDLTRSEFARS